MLPDLERAKTVITNYHAFKPRERLDLSKDGRSLLQGRGEALSTVETEGQMLQRVMPELMGGELTVPDTLGAPQAIVLVDTRPAGNQAAYVFPEDGRHASASRVASSNRARFRTTESGVSVRQTIIETGELVDGRSPTNVAAHEGSGRLLG